MAEVTSWDRALFNSGAGRVGAIPVAALRFHVFEYGKVIEIAGIVRISKNFLDA